jgi:hypothetical protein
VTIQEIARIEGISERQAQRYCAEPGYKGCVLKATRKSRAFVIELEDYRAWRVECGFDFLPQQDAVPEAPRVRDELVPEPVAPRPYPPYPQPANPGGPITNIPHPTSGSMPHPQACADYMLEQAKKLKAKLRGYDHDEN